MEQREFDAPELEGKGILHLIVEDGKKYVFLNGRLYMSWLVEDNLSQRIAIAQLYELGIVSQGELARVFRVNTKSVYNYIQTFKAEGASSLVNHKRGPKGSWKVNPRVRSKILCIVLKEGILEYESIQKRLEEWNEQVSIPSIRQVLLENGLINEQINDLGAWVQYQRELFKSKDEKQLYFDFGSDIESEELIPEREIKKKEEAIGAGGFTVSSVDGDGSIARRFYSQAQRIYLDQLEQGDYNTYAGGLLFAALLERYSFLPVLKRVINISTYEGYSLEELCLTLFYFDVFGFRSMEDFKRVYREEFGVLIGGSSSPSHFTLRRFLHRIKELNKAEELIEEYALEYLKTGIARWVVLYIDGHFLPYYGMYPITKGWHGVRKIPMKGSYNFVGVDEGFTPWIFLIRSSSEDLLQKIPEIIEKAKGIGKKAGLSPEQIDDLIVIFDREGYSAELYRYLDGRDREDGKRRVLFISWAKYAGKWVYDIPEGRFDKSVNITYVIQKPEEIKYLQTKRTMSKYGKIRTIVIQSGEEKKRAAIFTNGNDEEIGAEKVVQLICRRWGEENLIKELLLKHVINYFPGYVKEEMGEQPMVDNPKVGELKREKARLTSELHKLKLQLADRILKEAKDKTNWEEIRKTEIKLLADIVSIDNEILFLDQEVDKLPAKIRFDQAHAGERLLKLNYEKKRFLDCIKIFNYNIEKKMCEILLNYYDVKKEVLPVLSMIVKRGGYIKLEGGKLRVELRRFRNSEIDYAARHLCEDLNMMKPFSLDKYRLPIHYAVQ